jgi:glycosyltransferase involved in cell wall biosynthesis
MNVTEFFSLYWRDIVFYCFVVIAAIQLFYYLFYFSRLAFFKGYEEPSRQQHPVSVIVCARDEAANLSENLPGALVQTYPTTHEVIVVNDNSIDESKYLLDELKKTFRHLQHVHLTHEAKLITGKKYPLSMGIKEAKHELVLLTDADCVPASEFWIEKMQSGFAEGVEVVLGYGSYRKKPGWLNKLIRFETFHTALQYLSYALAGNPYMGVGRNLAYTKTIFFRNKGFSAINHVPGGDDDLFINMVANQHNTRIVIDKESITLSEPKLNWNSWVRQKTRHYSTGRFYKGKHRFLLGLYSFSHFMFYPLLLAALIVFDWRVVLSIFAVRFILQAWFFYKSMRRLNEQDLWPWWWFFDLWMFIYYIVFLPALFKKPSQTWN